MQKSFSGKLVALLLLLVLAVPSWYLLINKTGPASYMALDPAISDYTPARDKEDIRKSFHDDWYWLLESMDYSVDHMLDTHSPNSYEKEYQGKMKIKVIREDDKLAGFVTYYPENTLSGRILFLHVSPEFRGKKFGERLIRYAVNDFFNEGKQKVWLLTRVGNARGQALYERLNMQEIGRDPKFVYYQTTKRL